MKRTERQHLKENELAVFAHEDRGSEHRLKADEAYEIGERGHPVRAYLDPEAIVTPGVDAHEVRFRVVSSVARR